MHRVKIEALALHSNFCGYSKLYLAIVVYSLDLIFSMSNDSYVLNYAILYSSVIEKDSYLTELRSYSLNRLMFFTAIVEPKIKMLLCSMAFFFVWSAK